MQTKATVPGPGQKTVDLPVVHADHDDHAGQERLFTNLTVPGYRKTEDVPYRADAGKGLLKRKSRTRIVSLNCRTLGSQLQQYSLSKLLNDLNAPVAMLQETRIRGLPEVRLPQPRSSPFGKPIGYTMFCGDCDENGVGGCAIAVRSDLSRSVTNVGSSGNRLYWLKMKDKHTNNWFVSAHAPHESSHPESKDLFWEELLSLMRSIPKSHNLYVGIDSNGQMGLNEKSPALGKWYHAAPCTNDNGQRLLDFCETSNLILATTTKRVPRNMRLTFQGVTKLSQDGKKERRMESLKSQIDFVLVRESMKSYIMSHRSYWKAEFESDHKPVALCLRLRFEKLKNISKPRLDVETLSCNPDVRKAYRVKVGQLLSARTKRKDTNPESLFKAIAQAAHDAIPTKQHRPAKTLTSPEAAKLLTLMLRYKNQGNMRIYRRYKRALRRQIQKDKELLWESRCGDIEQAWLENNSRKVYTLLKVYSGRMKRNPGILRDPHDPSTSVVGEASLEVFRQHFSSLLNQPVPNIPPLVHTQCPVYAMNVSPPSREEVEKVIRKLKGRKAAGVDDLSPELFKHLPDSAIRDLTSCLITLWEEERIPDAWKMAVVVPLHKKGSITDPGNYRGISLLPVAYKILERIITDRLVPFRECTAREEQAGFRPGRGTVEQIFSLRKIVDLHYRHHEPLNIAFLDFASAFDSPDRERLYDAMVADGVPQKIVRLLRNMNSDSSAIVRSSQGDSKSFDVHTGVRQGSVAGPLMFNYVVDDIMRRVTQDHPHGVHLCQSDQRISDLDYADDIALFAPSADQLQDMVNSVSVYASAYGLRLRPEKCKHMVVGCEDNHPVTVDGEPMEIVPFFCYLGSAITNNSSYEQDIKQRIGKASSAFNMLHNALWSTNINTVMKLRVYLTAIRPILLYGSETWAAPRTVLERLDIAERKFMRRLLGYYWPDNRSNCQLRSDLNELYSLLKKSPSDFPPPSTIVRANRLRFLGHVLRRPESRIVRRAVTAVPNNQWKRRRGVGARKEWNTAVKDDLTTVEFGKQFRRTPNNFVWYSDKWMDTVAYIAQDRLKWTEWVRKYLRYGEDALER